MRNKKPSNTKQEKRIIVKLIEEIMYRGIEKEMKSGKQQLDGEIRNYFENITTLNKRR